MPPRAHTGAVDLETPKLVLHQLTLDETQQILRRQKPDGQVWAAGYPSIEQVDYLEAYIVEVRSPDHDSKWQSQLRRRSDGLVIGGAGVTGPVDDRGAIVIGFEVDPSVPDDDYGPEIVEALLAVARGMGAVRAMSSTRIGDELRLGAYRRCGFSETIRDESVYVERAID